MLAGVGSIDFVLFVIAADQSIKPQTLEHFDICRLLGISKGLIVLTKIDLVEPELLQLVRLEVEEFVSGSFLQGSPIVPVSSQTGEGLEMLRECIRNYADEIPSKDETQPLRLPVDRAIHTEEGGTVVTGTALGGMVSLEQELEAHPGGERLRVRGIQVHGVEAKSAKAGQRIALAIADVEPAALPSGTVLTQPGLYRSTRQVDCLFELLGSAGALVDGARVDFHSGSAEVEAKAQVFSGQGTLEPGRTGFVRFRLKMPVLLFPGDRFIARSFSPAVTIGGGTVLDITESTQIEGVVERLAALQLATTPERLALLIRDSGDGITSLELAARTGLTLAGIEKAVPSAQVVRLQGSYLDRQLIEDRLAGWREELALFHEAQPLAPGIVKEELRARDMPGASAGLFDALIALDNQIVNNGETLRLACCETALTDDETEALARIERAFEEGGLTVPSVKEVLGESGVEEKRARTLLQILLKRKALVRVNEDLVYHPAALEELRSLLAGHDGERFSVPMFKEWTGVSRKYAIPLLEFLDRSKITKREGDERVVM